MFKDEVVWITGASSGIGEALAKAFANEGSKLVLSARRPDELERVSEACRAEKPDCEVLVLPLDVTDRPAMPGAVQAVLERFGRIDWLINNAGISQRSLCIDTEMAVYDRLMEVDVLGQIALTREVLPVMVEQQSGHFVVTSSVAGKLGAPFRTGYSAAKHAVMGFFDALRAEVNCQNIKVTTLTPGYIQTDIARYALRGNGEAFGRTDKNIAAGMPVDECARVIMKGFRKGKPEIPVGKGFEMNGLWMRRFFPRQLFRVMAGQVKHWKR